VLAMKAVHRAAHDNISAVHGPIDFVVIDIRPPMSTMVADGLAVRKDNALG